MKAHMAWLNTHYKSNLFLASGRKVPRTGGILIAHAPSKAVIECAMAEDPFVKNSLAQCTITEFQTSQMHAGFKALIKILDETSQHES